MKIDSHQHFWIFDPIRDSWIDDSMKVIQRDFMPLDLQPALQKNGLDGCVVVQSNQSEEENEFQLKNAGAYDFIKGIVGWVDLRSSNIEERLEYYSQFPAIKGFRHVLQGEPQRDLMLQPAFMNGIRKLKTFGYTYDILIFPDQLGYTKEFVQAFPDQPFVIDHIAKPAIRDKQISDWKKDMAEIARFDNVYCKISGMVTEANWSGWSNDTFKPYIDAIVEQFGTKRIMYGSDWPVCQVAASYDEVFNIVKEYFSSFSSEEQDLFFGKNATAFYNL